MTRRRVAVLLGVFLVASLWGAPAASAHPLGNFTVNSYSGLVVRPDSVRVDYVLDLAELPTFQARSAEVDTDRDGATPAAELAAWSRRTCGLVATGVHLSGDGHRLPVTVDTATAAFRPGTAGLETLRLECTLAASGTAHRLDYRTTAYADRVGWREVTAVGDRTTVRADVPRDSVSGRLTRYPPDLLTSPLDVRTARLDIRSGGPPLVPGGSVGGVVASARGTDALTVAFTDFVGRPQLSLGIGLLALVLAVLLGGAHAFAPGHGKTVMAAYLVGQRGSFRHAAIVAATVTITHTAGVLVLGLVLTTAVVLAPTRLYAWLGVTSGLLLVTVGTMLAYRSRHRQYSHQHHGHHDHSHPHPHTHPHGAAEPPIGRGGLLAMGFVGGLVPSPSAVVVLLGAVALGRSWFGVLLVVGYGVGMALTLAGLGYLLARYGRALERRGRGRTAAWLGRTLPLATASLVVVVGLVIALQASAVLVAT
jgi:ABC-type nickel/cobalt efflux system permease component RcnA